MNKAKIFLIKGRASYFWMGRKINSIFECKLPAVDVVDTCNKVKRQMIKDPEFFCSDDYPETAKAEEFHLIEFLVDSCACVDYINYIEEDKI